MTFARQYEQALTIETTSSHEVIPLPQYFAGDFYELPACTDSNMPIILSGGTIEISTFYALHFNPLNYRMLLYTENGSGILELYETTQNLQPGDLLYLNCQDLSFTLRPTQLSWRFNCFLFYGEIFSAFESLVSFQTFTIAKLDDYSPVLRDFKKLLAGSRCAALANKLNDASLLTSVVSGFFIHAYSLEKDEKICVPYLMELKRHLDTSFMEPFRLDELEKRYHMSKYRICHEFSAVFGVPPLKYLNRKRLETAASLLFTTDKKIHEIALMVGYENTNHFINLFKREYGSTPQAYREAHQH